MGPQNGSFFCHSAGAKNFEVAARFFENLWAVAVTLSLAAAGPLLV